MARHVVSISGVTLGLQADKAALLVGLIEHQEGAITSDFQALLPHGVADFGLPLPTAIAVVDPPLWALPAPKVEPRKERV